VPRVDRGCINPDLPGVNRGVDAAQLNPLDPTIGEMMNSVIAGGARILVCPPCARVRGYTEDDLVDGAVLAGAPVMLEQVAAGATSLSF
jgi:predicted peroxiredoxin